MLLAAGRLNAIARPSESASRRTSLEISVCSASPVYKKARSNVLFHLINFIFEVKPALTDVHPHRRAAAPPPEKWSPPRLGTRTLYFFLRRKLLLQDTLNGLSSPTPIIGYAQTKRAQIVRDNVHLLDRPDRREATLVGCTPDLGGGVSCGVLHPVPSSHCLSLQSA